MSDLITIPTGVPRGHGPSICVRCPKVDTYSNCAVPVSMVLDGVSLCPRHVVEEITRLGLTLDAVMRCARET